MGTLYIVATPIGNLNDFSPRAINTLRNSDIILVEDTRQTIKLLNHFDIKTKMISYHKFNETKRTNEIIEELKNGKNVSLVSDAGTPCISDPGFVLVKSARENDINVIAVPGCCAAISALSVSGLDTSSFTFYGFVPTDNKPRKELFQRIKDSDINIKILYESPKRIIKLLEDIKKEIPGCVVCVCTEITKIHEKAFYGKIEDVCTKLRNDTSAEKGEYVVLVNNNKEIKTHEEKVIIESLLIDEMIKNNCSMKVAIENVNNKYKDYSKKDIYKASLKIKEIINK